MVGGVISELMVLGSIRKQTELAMRRKQAGMRSPSIASASASAPRILHYSSSCPDFLQ